MVLQRKQASVDKGSTRKIVTIWLSAESRVDPALFTRRRDMLYCLGEGAMKSNSIVCNVISEALMTTLL